MARIDLSQPASSARRLSAILSGGVSFAQMIEAQDRHALEAERLGGEKPGVASDEDVIVIDDQRADEPERGDRRLDLVNLAFVMGARMARVPRQVADGDVGDLEEKVAVEGSRRLRCGRGRSS
jgi:hypothetical protein